MRALFTAIVSRFEAVTGGQHSQLYQLLDGRLYNTGAPVGERLPLAVVSLPVNTTDQFMEKCRVQFSLFSDKSGDTEVLDLYDALIELYDNCDLPALGSPDNTGMERFASRLFRDSGVWQYVVEYEVWVERQ